MNQKFKSKTKRYELLMEFLTDYGEKLVNLTHGQFDKQMVLLFCNELGKNRN